MGLMDKYVLPPRDAMPVAQIEYVEDIRVSPEDAEELSKYLGRNISSSIDLVSAARNVATLRINGMESAPITLDPYLLNRLRSRCHPTTDFPKFVREQVVKLLSDFCGC